MKKKAFRSDWDVRDWALSDAKKEIEIGCSGSDGIRCENCQKTAQDFIAKQQILRDTNPLLNRMLAKEADKRPSARDLKIIWNEWEE